MTDSPIRTTSTYKVSHALTGPYLPPPGRPLGWPFAEMGRWRIDVTGDADEWLRGFTEWRTEHLIRIGFEPSLYEHPDLEWAQRNFVHVLTMVEDRYLYDAAAGRYTVDRYLDDLEARFGQVDSVLLWYIYPNIGIDDRSQFDLAEDLPGGIEALKGVIADFHRRGVKVMLPTMPWDNGTKPSGKPDWERIIDLVAATGADGINGDTYSGVPLAFHKAAMDHGRPLVLQPESTAQAGDHILTWNVQSWSKRVPDESIPIVLKLKWLEPRHVVNIENRWSRARTSDLQHALFNGIGYVAWENVFGFWNQLTDRDAETLRRVAMVLRRFWRLVTGQGWRPYYRTLQFGVFASRFPGERETLWTLINRNDFSVGGEQVALPHIDGAVYFDVWSGVPVEPRIDGNNAFVTLEMDGRGFGAVLQRLPGKFDDKLEIFLAEMQARAGTPLSSLSGTWHSAQQLIVPIEPTAKSISPAEGMIAIPAADFDFDVHGVVIEGAAAEGVDVQYSWESTPRRHHRHRMRIEAFCIDRFPVTNADFKRFIDASGYAPADSHNFLRHWNGNEPAAGWGNKPVTWVSIEDARAFAAWAGKRLPHEWEWQYAAQGNDGRLYPWGNEWRPAAVPEPSLDRTMPEPADVDAYPDGASPFGVMAMVGNVWQWTDEYVDEHVRSAVLRGGSNYQPQTSHWYFPQAYALNEHGRYLLMAPSKDRSAGIGFRCAADL